MEIIRPALAHPRGSRERAAAIEAIAAARHLTPDGRRSYSESTLRGWISAYEAGGAGALCRQGRSDKGARRVFISRLYDGEMRARGVTDDTLLRFREAIERYAARCWAHGVESWRDAQNFCTGELIDLTRKAGIDLPDSELWRLCTVPKALVKRERRHRMFAVRHKDAKAYFDQQPRIRRDYSMLKPLDKVIGDVHHADFLWERHDGSHATAKFIGWQDAATNHLIAHLVFLEKGEGVRMEHVANSFAMFVQQFGMPKHLYLDNGGEYNWAEFAAPAMSLCKVWMDADDRQPIVRALPYNAPAKKIENTFRIIEGIMAKLVPHIGGNRMAKKTHQVGKAPAPFPGSQYDLWKKVQQGIDYYNARPQQGQLAGQSPNDALASAIADGWAPIRADKADLETAFAREVTRTLRQGTFQLSGVAYTHENLWREPGLDRVTVRVPIFGDRQRIGVYDGDRFVCHAEPDRAYQPLDPAGAQESARRKRIAAQAVDDDGSELPPIDFTTEIGRYLALNPRQAAPEPDGRIQLTEDLARDAEGRRKHARQPRIQQIDENRARHDNYMSTIGRLMKTG